jgi:glycosyltransferase involved in cell wall biosynthesis
MVTKKSKLYIQADNIHSGGGKILLNALIKSKNAQTAFFILDSRMNLNDVRGDQLIRVIKPTILNRFLTQLWLWRNLNVHDVLLCFGNLPPLFNIKAKVVVFIQNIYIITENPLIGFPLKARIRISIERLWFKTRCHKVKEFFVQSPSMETKLQMYLSSLRNPNIITTKVQVFSFMNNSSQTYSNTSHYKFFSQKVYDFIYPASGEVHKNHLKLIDAFVILSKEGYFPSLVLTLDSNKFSDIIEIIDSLKNKFKLNIYNLGFLPHESLLKLYQNCSNLIYPSLFESLGLPLLEAKQIQLPIIASELDYVRDFVIPKETFDPNSSLSIARAIKRALGVIDNPVTTLNADEFLTIIY